MENTMKSIWDEVNATSDATFPGWRKVNILYWATSLAGEVGEFCNLAKKREEGGPRAEGVNPTRLIEELVDVYIYLQKTAESLGTGQEDFAQAVRAKLAVVRERNAPARS
jgi:hypothetical protein